MRLAAIGSIAVVASGLLFLRADVRVSILRCDP